MIGTCTLSLVTGALCTATPSTDVAEAASGRAAATVAATELAVVKVTSILTSILTLAADTVMTTSLLLTPAKVANLLARLCCTVASMSETSPATESETTVWYVG